MICRIPEFSEHKRLVVMFSEIGVAEQEGGGVWVLSE
jgi:hypothetical protein